jgi:LSD1 subclass zinc finger protein
MLLQCANCGAPLDGRAGAKTVKCNYCNQTNVTAELVTVAPAVPPAWRPPPTWTPPAHFPAQSVQLSYRRTSSMATGLVTGVILVAVGGVVAAVLLTTSGWGRAAMWDGSKSLVCNGNDAVVVKERTVDARANPAMIANGNCTLTLIDCNIRGETGLIANGPVHVIVDGGRITGRKVAVMATGGATVELRRGAVLEGTVNELGGRVVR